MPLVTLTIVALVSACSAQTNFGGSSSTSSKSGSVSSGNSNTDTRFFIPGLPSPDPVSTAIGVGLGVVGASVLAPAVGGALSNNNNPCGRRKRQANFGTSSSSGSDGTNTKFLGALLGGGSSGQCNCGRRRRREAQAPGEDGLGVRFFGLDSLLGGGNNNCGGYQPQCNCGYNQGFSNQGSWNSWSSSSNQGSYNRCQCNYNLTFRDQYGNTHGACRRSDQTGRTWCYTTGWGVCSDQQASQRFQNNPWSYQACNSNGRK